MSSPNCKARGIGKQVLHSLTATATNRLINEKGINVTARITQYRTGRGRLCGLFLRRVSSAANSAAKFQFCGVFRLSYAANDRRALLVSHRQCQQQQQPRTRSSGCPVGRTMRGKQQQLRCIGTSFSAARSAQDVSDVYRSTGARLQHPTSPPTLFCLAQISSTRVHAFL